MCVTVTVAITVDAAKGLFPGWVRLRTRTQSEDGSRRRINVEYAPRIIDNDHTVIDVAKNRQDRDIGIRQALLQAAALHGVVEYGVLAFDRNIVDTHVALGTGSHGSEATMSMLFPG